jgi:phosphoribosylformimino-5-aminoimidazole carboxamide ribonucleotide (ProFAR) isomerase
MIIPCIDLMDGKMVQEELDRRGIPVRVAV